MGTQTTVGTITATFDAIKAELRANPVLPLRRLAAMDRLLTGYTKRCYALDLREDTPDALVRRACDVANRIERFQDTTLGYRLSEANGEVC